MTSCLSLLIPFIGSMGHTRDSEVWLGRRNVVQISTCRGETTSRLRSTPSSLQYGDAHHVVSAKSAKIDLNRQLIGSSTGGTPYSRMTVRMGHLFESDLNSRPNILFSPSPPSRRAHWSGLFARHEIPIHSSSFLASGVLKSWWEELGSQKGRSRDETSCPSSLISGERHYHTVQRVILHSSSIMPLPPSL